MPEALEPRLVSIVMPAYQLGDVIAANAERVLIATAPLGAVEIIVSDDGSTDRTHEESLRAAAAHPEIQVVRSVRNQGKGAAFRRGFEASGGSIVVLLDGDLDLPPEQVPRLVDLLGERNLDVLVGQKLATQTAHSYPAARRFLSRVFSFVARILFRLPVSETQTGLKLFRREALESTLAELRITRYSFDLELLVRIHRAGFRIASVPVELSEKEAGDGVRLRTLWEMGRDTLRIWWWSLRG